MAAAWNPLGPLFRQNVTRRRGLATTSRQACGMYLAVGAPMLGHRGVIVGRERYAGKAFIYDPFLLYSEESRVRLPAPHMLVLGKSGYGKSAMVKTYVLRQLSYRDRSFVVLDAQGEGLAGEWQEIADALDVIPIRLTYGGVHDGGIRINPLDPEIPLAHQQDLLTSMVEIVAGEVLTSDAKFAIEVALNAARRAAADRRRVPVLSDVLAAITDPQPAMLGQRECASSELREWGMPAGFALHALTSGNLAGLFDGETVSGTAGTSIDLTGRLVIFDMARLPREGEALPLFMAVIGAWLRFGWIDPASTTKYTLVIEEAWHILAHRPVARLFNEFMRFGRRLGLSVIAVAHHLSDLRLDEVPEAVSIIKLSATRVVYHIEGDDADTVADYLELPAWAREAIKDPANLAAPGNGIWSFSGLTLLVQHLRTPAETALTNTNKRMSDGPAASPDAPSAAPSAGRPAGPRTGPADEPTGGPAAAATCEGER
ncbi:hypothetical protein [Spirillospora sp. CA-128828]|uniref:hypothetical protein n=1 Tax=Spirillospora sp. CA-128828 TaxID=3240033 RepID=UPI003D94F5FF